MPFDWMHVAHPRTAAQVAQAKRVLSEEYRGQAALLRRLGYAKEDALRRCISRSHWDLRPGHAPVLSDAELKALVTAVYA